MNTSQLTRQQLEIINRKTLQYPLQIAEKDYFLAIVMQIISNSDLQNTLIFKGGTALHHCYLKQYRFSEDLDFSSNRKALTLMKVKDIFTDIDFIDIKKDYVSNATIKIEKLQYIGPLVQPNSLKIEVDYLQNVVLPPRKIKYQNVWGLDFQVNIMDIKEICAEKVRAMNDRARYRDFYDFSMIIKKLELDLNEVIDLVGKKEIRKAINVKNIKSNWKIAKGDKQNDFQSIYFLEELKDTEIYNYLSKLKFEDIEFVGKPVRIRT